MQQIFTKLTIVPLLITFLIVIVLTPVAQASVIDTRTILAAQSDSAETEIQGFLARDEVREQLIELGVNPDDAIARVNALNNLEIAQLQRHIHDLPAGSNALAVLGAVFLVLLVLELVGVTNIFNKL